MGAPQVPIGVAVLLMVPSGETEQSGSTTVRIAGGDQNHRYRTDQARQARIPERESTGDTDGEMRNGPQRVILIRNQSPCLPVPSLRNRFLLDHDLQVRGHVLV
jgi:hypothetical protein